MNEIIIPSSMEWTNNTPHRRKNILNNTWVLCSPHRAKRPWLGKGYNMSIHLILHLI